MSGVHTPGPWHYRNREHDDWGIVRAEGGVICQARDPNVWDADQLSEHRRARTDPWEANARLVAAAPELLEALELVVKRCGPRAQDGAIARAAIAKARGRS